MRKLDDVEQVSVEEPAIEEVVVEEAIQSIDIKKITKEWTKTLLLVLAFLVILYFLFWPFLVQGESMEDTYFSGDRIFVSRFLSSVAGYERLDVVVCKFDARTPYIVKRVIGLPGETIELREGKVYIDGMLFDEYYINTLTFPEMVVTVGNDEYFVMGDNRSNSLDSRACGSLSRDLIVGKVLLRLPTGNKG